MESEALDTCLPYVGVREFKSHKGRILIFSLFLQTSVLAFSEIQRSSSAGNTDEIASWRQLDELPMHCKFLAPQDEL